MVSLRVFMTFPMRRLITDSLEEGKTVLVGPKAALAEETTRPIVKKH